MLENEKIVNIEFKTPLSISHLNATFERLFQLVFDPFFKVFFVVEMN